MDGLDFPGVVANLGPEVLVLHSQQPLVVLSSAVVGGGLGQARYLLNRQVPRDYDCPEPAADLRAFASRQGITEAFVGCMTAVRIHTARAVTLREAALTVAAVITAGVGNATVPGLSTPAWTGPGTINIWVLLDACLTPAAMLDAVIVATEVKAQTLMIGGIRTPAGHLATGTSTDALAVASTGRGPAHPYAGPATPLGWLLGRCVRAALNAALLATGVLKETA
ncbi:MAG: adenosylcobinamide amidohydrolase [Candidatus Tectimicrobiota bacterium]